jgi:chromosomal replication initiation ATPase DnaA
VERRRITMYIMRDLTPLSLVEIARLCRAGHHTTVVHSVKKCRDLMDVEPEFNQRVRDVQEMILFNNF